MSGTAGFKSRLLVGKTRLSARARSFAPSIGFEVHDDTSFEDDGVMVYYRGRRLGPQMTVQARFDDSTASGSFWSELTGHHTNDSLVPIIAAPAGYGAGQPAWLAEALQSTFGISTSHDSPVDMNLTFDTTGFPGFGELLTGLDTVTSTSNGSAVDGDAASSDGGVAHLFADTVSGVSPTLDVTVEHSVDGSTGWDTLATATAAERVVVAAGTTVRRHLRAAYTVGGSSPSFAVAVAFARS